MAFRKNIRLTEACKVLYEILEALDEPSPICGASFNVILEGIFRDDIKVTPKDNVLIDEIIEYKGRCFYVTKLKTSLGTNDFYHLPIVNEENKFNASLSPLNILIKKENYYIYYDLEKDSNGKYKKVKCSLPKRRKWKVEMVAHLYNIVTKENFFVEENQYLKAMFFKLLFGSTNDNSLEHENANRIIDRSRRLLSEKYKNNLQSIQQYNIDASYENIEPYIICNAFIDAYNQLSNKDKALLLKLYDEYHDRDPLNLK